MAQSLHQSRQPQYREDVNIKLSLKDGAVAQDKHQLWAQIHNQQSYLKAEKEQRRQQKPSKFNLTAQLDRPFEQIDQQT